MIAVAVFGMITGLVIERERRRTRFIQMAARHYRAYAQFMPNGPQIEDEPPRVAYHHSMGIKYEQAARHPWLPVWPDPPDPPESR
jgi:hypothetical protein